MRTLPVPLVLAVILVWPAAVVADPVSITYGNSSPPYAIEETASGIDVDICRAALAYRGHVMVPEFVPTARILKEFVSGNVDGASLQLAPGCCDGFLGDVSVEFEDVILTLDEANIEVKQPADLLPYRVMSFFYAMQYYGEWLKPVADLGNYQTIANQTNQLKMLLAGRVDVVIGDKRVFGYLAKKIADKDPDLIKKLRVTRFTEPWRFSPMFRTERIRDDFNAGLAYLRQSGQYSKIVNSYDSLYESKWLVLD